jgi:serine/threonine-protein kinase
MQPTTEVPFTRLGRYEVLAPIAVGGMASVYVGRAIDGGRPVALKVIRPEHAKNKEFVAMFLDEAGIVSNLSHPNIVELVEFGHDGARYFLAMDLVLGQTLARIAEVARARGKRVPYDVVAWIGARIAEGLHHAHELKDSHGAPLHVVHRDVNPSNILVAYDGVPKIIDFGLARAASRIASTAAGVVKGKLAYLAPEQAHREPIDRRADVFQLGITLWELALDRRLFKADDEVETVRRVMSSEVPDPRSFEKDFPPALAQAVMRALSRDRDQRTPTGADLARELDAFVAGRVGAGEVAALVAALFPEDGRRSVWEKKAREITKGGDSSKLLAWDDDAKKMTWMAVEVGGGGLRDDGLDRATLRRVLDVLGRLSERAKVAYTQLTQPAKAEV